MNKRKLPRIVEYKYREHGYWHSGSFRRPADWSDSDLCDALFDKLAAGETSESEYTEACGTVFAITYREGHSGYKRPLLR